MIHNKKFYSFKVILVFAITLILIYGGPVRTFAQDVNDAKAFKILKEKIKDPKTGLPKTLEPDLIKGKDKEGYLVAKEIPEILAQIPCFCGCEAVGHENLLDCFVDEHGVG